MRKYLSTSVVLGLVILLIGHLLWFGSLWVNPKGSSMVLYVWWLTTATAALVTSLRADKYNFLNGMFIAIPATVLTLLFNLIFELGGQGDFEGTQGMQTLGALALASNVALCLVGATGALLIANIRRM